MPVSGANDQPSSASQGDPVHCARGIRAALSEPGAGLVGALADHRSRGQGDAVRARGFGAPW